MLKDKFKSVQSELKYNQQEVLTLKNPILDKRAVWGISFAVDPRKTHAQVPENNFFVEPIKESLFKKQSLNLFKAKSRFRVNSKKTFALEEAPSLLRYIVKGYLAFYALLNRKKETMKIHTLTIQRGYWKRALYCKSVKKLCLIRINGIDVDYKDY